MSPDSQLLMNALLAPPADAEACWRTWRAETDLDRMSEDCVQLLPMLVASSPEWLADDSAKNLILGICKRAWTRNQLMLRSLAELIGVLEHAGVKRVAVAGPPAWALVHQSSRSFRPISFLELAIPRRQAIRCVEVLASLGWVPAPGSELHIDFPFDRAPAIWLHRSPAEALKLSWRLFPAPSQFAAAWEWLPLSEIAGPQGAPFSIVPREALLATALTEIREGEHPDWQLDALPLLREGGIDWDIVKEWIRFAPGARANLVSLARQADVFIPESMRRESVSIPLLSQWEMVMGEYRRRAATRREPLSTFGFISYLCNRWQVPLWQVPFRSLFYTVRHTFFCSATDGRGK